MRRAPFSVALVAALALTWAPAWADVYSFVDADGQIHLSDSRRDGRYALVVKDPRAVPTANPAHQSAAAPRDLGSCLPGIVADVAGEHRLSAHLLQAVIAAESACNPVAVSPKGAQGLMQLMPGTAARYGVANAFDPAQNLRGGAMYLRDLVARYGQRTDLALAAYNAGEDAVLRYGNDIPPFPETQEYVRRVLAFYTTLAGRPAAGVSQPDRALARTDARPARVPACSAVSGVC